MASGTKGPAESELRTLFEVGTVVGRSDGELLDRFLTAGGPDSERAFAALVEWHGPMVWRVCRDVLRESNDADDAFQATFLVLARRAGAIRERSSLGPWLHGVALRVSRSARVRTARRRSHDRVAARPERDEPLADVDHLDAAPVLHEEVGRLPEKYRAPVVLCYFEGLTHDQAASRLGWPVGTVRSRLAKARDRLRPHLLRRGMAPSFAMSLATGRAEVVPAALASATVAMAVGAGAAGSVPAAVAALVGTMLREMTLMKTSMIAAGLVAATLLGTAGVGYVAVAARPQDADKVAPPKQAEPIPKAEAMVPAPIDPDRERINPPGSNLRSGVSSSRVLWARLHAAAETFRVLEAQHQQARVEYSRVSTARGEVEALAAELGSSAEDLDDEVELLQAQLEIKKADAWAAKAQMARASESHEYTDRLAKKQGVSQSEVRLAQSEVDLRSYELAKKKAEVNEVEIRIKQATRRRDEAKALVKRAKELFPEQVSPANPTGAAAKP